MLAMHHCHESQHVEGVDVSQGVYHVTARQIWAGGVSRFSRWRPVAQGGRGDPHEWACWHPLQVL